MDGMKIGIVIVAIPVFLLLLALTLESLRRKKQIERVRHMEPSQKIRLLNELAEPFGFFYNREEDVFTSHVDAWQRRKGYEELYDKTAAGANIVIDAFPVYFEYAGKTWLIEFWKGQYGINIGGEVGIYHAKQIIPPYFYPAAHFDAAENSEMPMIRSCLEWKGRKIYDLCQRHWWLTGFRMGEFASPLELELFTTISFDDNSMAQAFFRGLQKTGLSEKKFCICCNEVYVQMDFSPRQNCLARIHRKWVQCVNRFYCWGYRCITRPFTDTVDRMLFLYYLLPFGFRQMLELGTGRFYKKHRRAERWIRRYHIDD